MRFKIALSGRIVEWLPRVHFFALTAPGSVIALAPFGHIRAANVHEMPNCVRVDLCGDPVKLVKERWRTGNDLRALRLPVKSATRT